MLAQLSKPSIAGVVFATLDRFFRPDQLSTYGIFKPFEEATGKRLFCELGELDPTNSQDQMRIVLYGQMAGFERERIKDRMVRGKNKNRVRPDIKSDTLPVGVKHIPDNDKTATGRFEYTPESVRVKEAFDRVLSGETLRSIADDLGWTSSTGLRATLKSYWWIGVKASIYKRTDKKWDEERDRMGEGRKVARENPIMVDTNLTATPLVSRETFFAVQDILSVNRTSWTQRKSRVNNFLCTGVIRCECGAKMYHKMDKRPTKPSYYLCSTNCNGKTPCGFSMIDSKRTDRDVWARIMLHTKSERYLAQQIARAMSEQNIGHQENEIRDIERKLSALDKEEKGIAEAIRYSGFNAALGEQMKDITVKRGELKAKLIVAKAQAVDRGSVDPQSIARQIKTRFWSHANRTPQERKALMSEMVDEIIVKGDFGDEGIFVRYRVPDSISRTCAGTRAFHKRDLSLNGECRTHHARVRSKTLGEFRFRACGLVANSPNNRACSQLPAWLRRKAGLIPVPRDGLRHYPETLISTDHKQVENGV
jgi:hypothetical protein